MNIICYGASVTAQKEQAGYFHALKEKYAENDNINFYQISFAASVFDHAGFSFMKSIENIVSNPTVCIIDWLTPGAVKFKLEKIETLSFYLLSLGCLPVWVNFPRTDDIENNRECYHQVKKHCEAWKIPFLDVYKDERIHSLDIEEVLRDKVHTTPLGGKLYAEVLSDFLHTLESEKIDSLVSHASSIRGSSLLPPSLINTDFELNLNNSIHLYFNASRKLHFELYFLGEIGPYTPILDLVFTDTETDSSEAIAVNCLDIWSHYNRIKCIKVLWKNIEPGNYQLKINALDIAAIDSVEIKKPVNKDVYPDGEPLKINVQQISCNVELTDFSVQERNNV